MFQTVFVTRLRTESLGSCACVVSCIDSVTCAIIQFSVEFTRNMGCGTSTICEKEK